MHPRRGRRVRRQRLGGRLDRQWQRDQRQDADPALERHRLDAGAQPDPGRGQLTPGVAATSAGSAWAVGSVDTPAATALILRWNGTTWTQVPSPARCSASS